MKFLEWLTTWLPPAITGSVFVVALFYVLKKVFEANLDAMKNKEVEDFKANINRELERFRAGAIRELEQAKHLYQLEQAKQSIVFQTQKSSFQAVIKSMNCYISAIEKSWDDTEDEFRPASEKDFEILKSSISDELLLIPVDGQQAVRLFMRIAGHAVGTMYDQPNDGTIRSSLRGCVYIRDMIVQYFQKKVGVSSHPSPLRDVTHWGACQLLSSYSDAEHGWPTKPPLFDDDRMSPAELAANAMANRALLISELNRFCEYLHGDAGSKTAFYSMYEEAKWYLNALSN